MKRVDAYVRTGMYVHGLLFMDNESLTFRCMDLIEMDIRQMEGNEGFRMDGMAEDFLINIIFDISMFGSYQIIRKFGYFS